MSRLRIVFIAFIASPITLTFAAEPEWKAPSLIPASRTADDIAARANLLPEAFEPKPIVDPNMNPIEAQRILDAWRARTQPLADCLDTIKQLDLCKQPHYVTLNVETLAAQPDGSLIVTGWFSPNRPARIFLSPQEEDLIRVYEGQSTNRPREFADAVARYNVAIDMLRRNLSPHDTVTRLEPLVGEMDAIVEMIRTRARDRQNVYERCTLEARIANDFGGVLERDKFLRTNKVEVLVKPNDVSLAPPDIVIQRPPIVNAVYAGLADVEKGAKRTNPPPPPPQKRP